MKKGLCEPYVLPELVIKLTDAAGNVIDKATANDIGVTVEFDYEPRVRGSDDGAQVYIRAIRSAGAGLDGDDITVNLWANRDIQGFLMQPDIDAIKDEIIDRIEGREKASYDEMRIDTAIEQRNLRGFVWGQK